MDSDYVHVTKADTIQPIVPIVTKQTASFVGSQPIKTAVVAPNVRPVRSDGSEKDEKLPKEQNVTTPSKGDKSTDNIAKHHTEELTVEKEKDVIEYVTNLIPVRQNYDEFLFPLL